MTSPGPEEDEARAVRERYARRSGAERYSFLKPDVWQASQERQRALLRLFARLGWSDLATVRLCEVGCGYGGNLLELLRLGFLPSNLSGVELIPARLEAARQKLPTALRLFGGDATAVDLGTASQDVVYVSTVFSSLLDEGFQQRLADTMWLWLRPGGGVLWYDFTVDNPRNPDVRGIPLRRVRELFPAGTVIARRVTLAPPLARAACRIHSWLYPVLNALPLLRTHVLAWIGKPR